MRLVNLAVRHVIRVIRRHINQLQANDKDIDKDNTQKGHFVMFLYSFAISIFMPFAFDKHGNIPFGLISVKHVLISFRQT